MNSSNYLTMEETMLISILNMKLRDFYPSLDALCEDFHLDFKLLTERLTSLGWQYNVQLNQIKPL